MSTQIYNVGMMANCRLEEGAQTSRRNIPLGWYVDDGNNRYRWAHIVVQAATKRGMLIGKPQDVLSAAGIGKYSALGMAKGCAITGFGGAAGDDTIKLYSAYPFFNDTAQSYADGTMFVASGIGKGAAYRIRQYEKGVTATTTKLWLHDPLRAKLSTNTQMFFQKNTYRSCTYMSAGAVGSCLNLGFATASTTVSGYQWIQSRGIGVAIASGAVQAGNTIWTASAGSGHVRVALSATAQFLPVIGTALRAAAEDGYLLLDISIE